MSKMLLPYAIMQKLIVFVMKREKILLFMLVQCLIISILPCQGFLLLIKSKSLRNVEVNTVHNKNDSICNLTPSGLQLLLFS